ncbi:MAG: acetyl-CoA carboxylase biotin carboxyl carrier protein [Phycisphaerales bacterium]
MIDIRKLKELVRLMVENELSELDIKDQQETVTIKRGNSGPVINHQPVIYTGGAAGGGHAGRAAAPANAEGGDDDGPETPAGPAPAAASAGPSDAGLVAVTSPMVGTFYASASPDTPVFVTAGTVVGPDTTVCLIEAMKVFNEIKAEHAGTIERMLVKNGQAVEYGQKLFMIRPA